MKSLLFLWLSEVVTVSTLSTLKVGFAASSLPAGAGLDGRIWTDSIPTKIGLWDSTGVQPPASKSGTDGLVGSGTLLVVVVVGGGVVVVVLVVDVVVVVVVAVVVVVVVVVVVDVVDVGVVVDVKTTVVNLSAMFTKEGKFSSALAKDVNTGAGVVSSSMFTKMFISFAASSFFSTSKCLVAAGTGTAASYW